MRKIYILSGDGQKGAVKAKMHVSQCVCKVGVAIFRFVRVYMRAFRGIICISQNFSLPLLAFFGRLRLRARTNGARAIKADGASALPTTNTPLVCARGPGEG